MSVHSAETISRTASKKDKTQKDAITVINNIIINKVVRRFKERMKVQTLQAQ